MPDHPSHRSHAPGRDARHVPVPPLSPPSVGASIEELPTAGLRFRQLGIARLQKAFAGRFHPMNPYTCQRGGVKGQSHAMVYRMDMAHGPWSALRQNQGRAAQNRPLWESSPLRGPFLSLLRSRGYLGRVRGTPGSPWAAAARMDGPEGRAGGRPGQGKGLTMVMYEET